MALPDYSTGLTRPNQQNGAGALDALMIEEFTGMVESTIARRSVTEGFVPVRSVKGTSTVTNFNIGESTLGKVVPGVTPEGTPSKLSKNSVTIDTLIYARAHLALLETFQSQFDVRKEIASEHGKKIAKFKDQAFLIQGIKAALAATSPYGATPGFSGGSQHTLALAGDINDPAKMYSAFARLFTLIEAKDVDPVADGLGIFVRPDVYYTLIESEHVINGEYLTADGTKVEAKMFKAWGVPVMSTNNLPRSVVSGHLLGTDYDGDFSKVAALVMSPKAILAGENIPLTGDVFYDNLSKQWFADAHLAFAATPNRSEYAGAILLP